jgi:hypothetical protein
MTFDVRMENGDVLMRGARLSKDQMTKLLRFNRATYIVFFISLAFLFFPVTYRHRWLFLTVHLCLGFSFIAGGICSVLSYFQSLESEPIARLNDEERG